VGIDAFFHRTQERLYRAIEPGLTMSERHETLAEGAPKPVGLYPHARTVGPFVFLSGVGPREPGTDRIAGLKLDGAGKILSYDFEAQCHSVFKNVRVILESSGCRWEDLVDVTVYLINMKQDFAVFNKLYAQYFQSVPVKPCRTTVEVGALPTPIAIELKCVAYRPGAGD
jgi:2-aminomuconate deaminase